VLAVSVIWLATERNAESPETSTPDPLALGMDQLRAAAEGPTNVSFRNGFPVAVTTNVSVNGSDSVQRAIDFVRTYKGLYGQFMPDPFRHDSAKPNRIGIASPADEIEDFSLRQAAYQGKSTSTPDLALNVRGTSGPNDQVVAFYQTYRGIEVYGGNLLVFVDGKRVIATIGALLSDLRVDLRPRLTGSEAEEEARKRLGFQGAPALGRTELVIFDESVLPTRGFTRSEPRLAWRLALGGANPTAVLVDAQNGRLLHHATQVQSDYSLDLEDANGHNGDESDCYSDTTDDDALGDEDGLNDDGDADGEAVLLWNYATQTYSFYLDMFARDSYDDDGGEFELYVHAATQKGSQWVPDCELVDVATGFVAYDILVHEIAHGAMQYGYLGGPGLSNQGGALGESYADVMGSLADGNWTHGEARTGGGPTRNIADPNDVNADGVVDHPERPDHWDEYQAVLSDNGGVHLNSGIPSKAQFLLAAGGTHPDSGWTVTGIGKPAMGWLAYMVMENLPNDSSFLYAKAATWAYAYVYYPSWVVCSARNAWAAVGVGNGDINCDGVEDDPDLDHDGLPIGKDNCPTTPNPKQLDTDGDGKGNACDGDADEDGFPEKPGGGWAPGFDDCPGLYNPDQTDANLNGVGKACDPTEDRDFDDDGVLNWEDNCILDPNATQADVDNDGQGDACDPDSDGDGWSNDNDSCPFTSDSTQQDSDSDGVGDVCDRCPQTADEVTAWTTGNPALGIDPTPVQPDSDQDGTPDACDQDVRVHRGRSGTPAITDDGSSYSVETRGRAGGYLTIPLKAAPGPRRTWFEQAERRTLAISGVDPRVRTSIIDDTGRTVARTAPNASPDRRLRFRPLAGRRYFLVLYFSVPYGQTRRGDFTARLSREVVRLRLPPPPPPVRHT
jgi:Zn-dependent metalloprotease